jgi:PAS domain S-box-containing protein
MKSPRTLRQSLLAANALVSLLPLGCIALIILLLIIRGVREDFRVKIGMLSQGIRGQIQLFLNQPLTSLNTIGTIIAETAPAPKLVSTILNTHSHDSLYFESIYLLDESGKVINAGLPASREHYRADLIGIDFGHRREFKTVRELDQPVWSDTFLSLSSGKISLTLYVPTGANVLAADINLNALAQHISRLGTKDVNTMVIDRNGAIIFHSDHHLIGQSIMVNDLEIVAAALAGREMTGIFTFQGAAYLGSTSIIEPAGWVTLISEPADRLQSQLLVPLLIFTGGLLGAAALSLFLALYQARRLSRPLQEITTHSSVIAKGDYSHPLPTSDLAELEQLSVSINHMVAAIQKRELQLRDNELKYRELVEHTSNLVLRLERDFTISYANHTVERLTGIPAAEAIGQPLAAFMVDEDWVQLESMIAGWVDRRLPNETMQCRINHSEGRVSHLLLTINLHYTVDGHLNDLNVIGHDITIRQQVEQQQKELERQRQLSQKMELLGLMAGGVAHDLNNILAGIINYPELMLLRMEPDNPLRAQLQSIKKSGERAAAVVADLLTIARDSAAVYDVVNLNQVISGYIASPEFKKLCELHPLVGCKFTPAPALWHCACSQIHIEKAVMNLVINAFEAIKSEGTVTITTANIGEEESAALSGTVPPADYVAVKVQDSGTGISAEDKSRIFEPFFSKKGLGRSGTGLGLTVAWNSVREHGGTILVDSSDQGTVFTILLPATDATPTENVLPGEMAHFKGNGEHILVVDDEEALRDIAVNMLNLLGYRTSSAGSGEEALDFLMERQVDLILLDMQMAPGMSGKETYIRIKEQLPGQKALIASGYSTSQDVQQILRQGAGAFIKKPYSMVELGRAVHDILQAEVV